MPSAARWRRLRRSLGQSTGCAVPFALGTPPVAGDSLRALDGLLQEHDLSSAAARSARRGIDDITDGLGSDAYWRAKTWKRVLAIFAGPAANIVLALALFTGLFMTSGGKATTTVESVVKSSPAAAIGLQAGDRIVSINGLLVRARRHLPHDLRVGREASHPDGRASPTPAEHRPGRGKEVERRISAGIHPARRRAAAATGRRGVAQSHRMGIGRHRQLAGSPRDRGGDARTSRARSASCRGHPTQRRRVRGEFPLGARG